MINRVLPKLPRFVEVLLAVRLVLVVVVGMCAITDFVQWVRAICLGAQRLVYSEHDLILEVFRFFLACYLVHIELYLFADVGIHEVVQSDQVLH